MHDHDSSPTTARGVAEGIDTSGASTFDLELTAPAQGGQMVARLAGQVTFVSGGIPGEMVAAYVPTRRRGYLEGQATGVDRPSPDRVAPPCPYFGENGHRRGAIDDVRHRLGFELAVPVNDVSDGLVRPFLRIPRHEEADDPRAAAVPRLRVEHGVLLLL